MENKVIRLNEAELHDMICESIMQIILENEEDEGLWNQLKQGAKSFFGNGYRTDSDYRNTVADRQARGEHTANWMNGTTPMNLKGRWNAAKTGYREQGNIDNADKIRAALDNLESLIGQSVDQNTLNKMTIGQLKSKLGSAKGSAMSRVRGANNRIYKGQQTGVMGSGRVATV